MKKLSKTSKKILCLVLCVMFGFCTLFAVSPAFAYTNLLLDVWQESNITNSEGVKFAHTPEYSAVYHFEASATYDSMGYVYDSDGKLIASDDDSAGGQQFKITVKLEEGKTYFFVGKFWNADRRGKIKVLLTSEKSDEVEKITVSTDYYFLENKNGRWNTDSDGKQYFDYNLQDFYDSLEIDVYFSDGTKAHWNTELSGGTQTIHGKKLYLVHNQYINHWIYGEEDFLTVKYLGAVYKVPISILKKPIYYFTANVSTLLPDKNGVCDATVAIDDEVFKTDESGDFTIRKEAGTYTATVSAKNCIPREITIEVGEKDKYVSSVGIDLLNVDINGDNVADSKDIEMYNGKFGKKYNNKIYDMNGDGFVNIKDFQSANSIYGISQEEFSDYIGEVLDLSSYDLNGDNFINIRDVSVFKEHTDNFNGYEPLVVK